jgi:hypothetical protein
MRRLRSAWGKNSQSAATRPEHTRESLKLSGHTWLNSPLPTAAASRALPIWF